MNVTEELNFIKYYMQWPRYPWLPLKGYGPNKGKSAALYHDIMTDEMIFVDSNLFDSEKLESAPRRVITPDEVFKDGWIAD